MKEVAVEVDDGRAYGRRSGHSDADLYEVDAGTPAGELLRRYWHPVARSDEATSVPRSIRALGENLVLFRDGQGRPGLMEPRCCHRGTTLLYGKVENDGIRCCYHGWLFDAEGHCVDQPCEPDRGRNRDRYRQPWYPVVDYNGLVFAYMGPAEKQPVFPKYDIFEDLGDDEEIVIVDHFAFGGPSDAPCNWFQTHENTMDPYHVFILHNAISGSQFNPNLSLWPEVSFEGHPWGVTSIQDRPLDDGTVLHRVTEIRMPTIRVVATPTLSYLGKTNNMSWALPIDETHTRVYAMVRVPKDRDPQGLPTYGPESKAWHDLTEVEHQLYPGDYEAQVGQNAVTLHSTERLASSDRGVSMVRRLWKEQLAVIAAGNDPVGVEFGDDAPVIALVAGNYMLER
ncbi:MAG: Rieske 2Fe-2S domain-containing protein [Actinomycetota bacterium]|nr:Rieske 2Fe-2S domain-containing protein [Actinomycetota bacterium]